MTRIILRIVWLFRGLFVRQGIDAAQLVTIVETKMKMDQRRVYMNWKQHQQRENRNHLAIILLSYLCYGGVMAFFLYFIPSLLFGMTITQGFIFFMLSMTLVTDFSTVLLDSVDNQILVPKPVSGRTLFMARLVHIIIYILQFSLALGLAPILVSFYKYGLVTGISFIITFFLTVLSSVFFTYLLYLGLMRFISVSKIREVITYLQIFMTIIFVAGFQILPRMVSFENFANDPPLHFYYFLLPPYWMAYTIDAFHAGQFDLVHSIMIVLAFVLPLAGFYLLIKFLAPAFSRKMAAMEFSSNNPPVRKPGRGRIDLSGAISKLFSRHPVERSSLVFTWIMTGREKLFRLQFYPSLAYILVFVFIFIFRGTNGSVGNHWAELPQTDKYLWFIYLPVLTVSQALIVVSVSDQYLASWMYFSLPVSEPGMILSGALKALFIKYFLSVFLILSVFSISVWGIRILPDLIFGLFNDALCFAVTAYLNAHYLPFSRQPRTQQQSGKFIRVIIQMVIIGLLVGLHFLVLHLPYVKFMLMPISIAACWLLLTSIQRLAWTKIAI